jgi:hypothetical protein
LNVFFCRRQQINFQHRKYNYGTGLKKNYAFSSHFRLSGVTDRATTYCFPLHHICLGCSPGCLPRYYFYIVKYYVWYNNVYHQGTSVIHIIVKSYDVMFYWGHHDKSFLNILSLMFCRKWTSHWTCILDIYSASLLKQSAGRHVAPLRHTILILSKQAFAFTP